MVITPVTTHAARKSAGELVPRAISASTRKMPDPIMDPATIAVELKSPRVRTIPGASVDASAFLWGVGLVVVTLHGFTGNVRECLLFFACSGEETAISTERLHPPSKLAHGVCRAEDGRRNSHAIRTRSKNCTRGFQRDAADANQHRVGASLLPQPHHALRPDACLACPFRCR